jgi:hypothetical protein
VYSDGCETATITYHCNDSVKKDIPVNSKDDLADLTYVVDIISRELRS